MGRKSNKFGTIQRIKLPLKKRNYTESLKGNNQGVRKTSPLEDVKEAVDHFRNRRKRNPEPRRKKRNRKQ